MRQQKTLKYRQKNSGNIEHVFPLLCPVREKDWIDGWDYRMIHSKSGLIEQDCVFSTDYTNEIQSIWFVTQYNKIEHCIEFVKFTPGVNAIKINIEVSEIDNENCHSMIYYQYTSLCVEQDHFIQKELDENFQANMQYWEKAINHYLKTGEKLKK